MTGTFILTWNPSKSEWPAKDYLNAVRQTKKGKRVGDRWSVNRKYGIEIGDRAFLLRQHNQRGIVASGYFTSRIVPRAHYDGSNREANYADLKWDRAVGSHDRLKFEELMVQVPGHPWNYLQGSGTQMKDPTAGQLEQLWTDHPADQITRDSGEILQADTYREGEVSTILVNHYERDLKARKACILKHGTVCAVCAFDFVSHYGPTGKDHIHVHHLKLLSQVGQAHTVDPEKDLIPIRPNCHAMLHKRNPPYTIKELKNLMRDVEPGRCC